MSMFILVPTASKSFAIQAAVGLQSFFPQEIHLLVTRTLESLGPISLIGAKSHTTNLLGNKP